MKYASAVGLGLLLAAIALPAQILTRPALTEKKDSAVLLPEPTCPVSMHALQGTGRGMLAVRDRKPTEGPAQHIHLILTSATAARILAAKVLVRGQSGSASIMPASDKAESTSGVSRTLHLAFKSESADSVAADLLLPGFTTVRSIELQALTYTDGSTWAVAGEQACHVAPDPMMLVGSR